MRPRTLYLRQRLVEAEVRMRSTARRCWARQREQRQVHRGDQSRSLAEVRGGQPRASSQSHAQVASAGQGGAIEIRKNAPDGELLASVPVEVNGNWEQFYERTAEVPESTGRHDLFIRFVNEKNQGGLIEPGFGSLPAVSLPGITSRPADPAWPSRYVPSRTHPL